MAIIIPTSSANHLADELRERKDFVIVFPEKNKDGKNVFPDGEVYVKLPALPAEGKVVVLHSGQPDPNGGLQELEMILGILREQKRPAEVFFSYFPYSMQDKIHSDGELNAAENLIRKLVEFYQVKKIHIIDAHFFGPQWTAKYPLNNISAAPTLMAAAEKDYPDIVFLAPDKGSQERVNIKGFEKTRKNSFDVEMMSDDECVILMKDKVVGVVDDLLETGGTLVKFREKCLQCGARDVVALVTHGVLSSGIERVKNSYSKLYLTNTIKRPEANIDVSGLIRGVLSN